MSLVKRPHTASLGTVTDQHTHPDTGLTSPAAAAISSAYSTTAPPSVCIVLMAAKILDDQHADYANALKRYHVRKDLTHK